MAPRTSRRGDICRAAVTLAARGGSHAVTHQGIDAELGISRGSTSYYYRSRAALITAVADHLAADSRAEFESLLAQHPGGDPTSNSGDNSPGGDPAELIEAYVANLTSARRDQVRARLALLLDADCAPEQQQTLTDCLFSRSTAVDLFRSRDHPRPDAAATELLDRLEGRILRSTLFSRT